MTTTQATATAGPVNHLWVSHGLLMPFIHFALVGGLPPEAWTLARLEALGRYGYAQGFAVRLPLDLGGQD